MPGSVTHPNEDAFGSNSNCAFVVDGATGLGDVQFVYPKSSDAAWFAQSASDWFRRNMTVRSNPIEVIREFISTSYQEFHNAAQDRNVPRYAWPSASLAMIHLHEEYVTFKGLGDCILYVATDSGVKRHCALSGFAKSESKNAAVQISRVGGLKDNDNLLSNRKTLEGLRQVRALQNTSISGIWTLGLETKAADHLVTKKIVGTRPYYALLCSDGFSALVETYSKYSPEALLDATLSKGLGALMEELRHIENKIDPDATLYPRFKRSDDATVVLCSITD